MTKIKALIESDKESSEKVIGPYPVLPLKDVVVYPHMVIPLFVGRQRSVKAIEAAMAQNQKIFLVAQQDPDDDKPELDNLYRVGALGSVLQLLRLPDGTLKVLVEGNLRAKAIRYDETSEVYIQAELHEIEDVKLAEVEVEAMQRSLVSQFDQYVKLNKKIPPEVTSALAGIEDLSRLVDTIAAHMTLKIEDRQELLEEVDLKHRIEMLMRSMEAEIDVLQLERRIRSRVKQQMEKNQREYYLNEQLKAIQKELGEIDDSFNDLDNLDQKIKAAKMPKEAHEKAMSELKKLKAMSPMSAEATVSRNYIDWLLGVPWYKKTRIKHDLLAAQATLDNDHYGLEKIKERIIEYLAVQDRVKKIKGPILCLVGPPGVGKTSLGASIARATGRKFARIALGGVRDEAEIRGHRRTYVGALPGKMIQKIAKAGVKNPLVLLDEIDKVSADYRGDPSSALLEVLDPEQNHTFNDHYLEVDYDLSDVMFVATANSMNIPAPLLDRMEVIRLAGYTEDEKLNIALKYLLPKHIKQSGLKSAEMSVSEKAILNIIRFYTREAGVRGLEREIAKICRKVVTKILKDKTKKKVEVTEKNLSDFLGVIRYRYGIAEEENIIGQVTGLAWTEVGGELLKIEAAVMPGKGKMLYTGKLGEVMKESIQAAISVVRTRSKILDIADDFFEKHDIHVHVPEGATPKDGPSAGIAMCTALVSVIKQIPVRADVAMTGEITLGGQVLPIGGLKEKLLAANRGNIKTVLIPEENEKDLAEIPKNVVGKMKILPVTMVDAVLKAALVESPFVKSTSNEVI